MWVFHALSRCVEVVWRLLNFLPHFFFVFVDFVGFQRLAAEWLWPEDNPDMTECFSLPDTLEQERCKKRPSSWGLKKFITFIKDGAKSCSSRRLRASPSRLKVLGDEGWCINSLRWCFCLTVTAWHRMMWRGSSYRFQVPGLEKHRFSPVEISCTCFPAKSAWRWATGPESGVLEQEALKMRRRQKMAPAGSGGRGDVSLEPGTDGQHFGHRCRPTKREWRPKHTVTVGSYLRTSGSLWRLQTPNELFRNTLDATSMLLMKRDWGPISFRMITL